MHTFYYLLLHIIIYLYRYPHKFQQVDCRVHFYLRSELPVVAECACVGPGEEAPLPFEKGQYDKDRYNYDDPFVQWPW